MEIIDELIGIIDALGSAQIDYAVCGGLALALHGAARMTTDIDILVRRKDVEKAKAAVAGSGFMLYALPMVFRRGTENETRVHRVSKASGEDLLVLDLIEVEPANKEAWKSRRQYAFRNRKLRAVSREGLISMKRRAGRPIDNEDIERLEHAGNEKS